MTEEQTPGSGGGKKFSLSIKPVVVQTTFGPVHARPVGMKDIGALSKFLDKGEAVASEDYKELGSLAIQALVSTPGDVDSTLPLTAEMIASLSPDDFNVVAKAVAKASQFSESADLTTPESFGAAVFDFLLKSKKQMADTAAKIQQTIDTSFGTLSDRLKVDLGSKFEALSAARNALGTTAVEAALRVEQTRTLFHAKTMEGLALPDISVHAALPTTPRYEPPRIPNFKDTDVGRAATRATLASEESAKQLNEVSGIMGTMAEQMAGLQTVFLSEVLPTWKSDLQSSADATNLTLDQAKSSLSIAKYALVASVVVSIVLAAWQVWLASEYKRENDKQQEQSQRLMQQQLDAVQELTKQLRTQAKEKSLPAESAEDGKDPRGNGKPALDGKATGQGSKSN